MNNQLNNWKNWLEKAKDDLRWISASLKDNIYYGACFAAQQASEKAIKAYLLFKGKTPRRIHDLSALLEDCIELEKDFKQLIDQAATLSGYYVEARYPDVGDFMGYSKEQGNEALQFAETIVSFIISKTNENH
ncbi:MAG: HEPN domain-containing protein [Patescibacteria group bacterium]